MTTTSCLLHQIWTQFLFCHMLFISLLYKQCMDTATARHVCSTSLQANFTAHMRSDSSIASHTYTKLVFNFVLRLGSKWKREGIRRSMFPWRQQYIHVTIHFSEMPFLIYTLHTQAAKLTANIFLNSGLWNGLHSENDSLTPFHGKCTFGSHHYICACPELL